MRATLALTILLVFGLDGTAPEPEYSPLFADYFHAMDGNLSLVDIEASIGRADRLVVASVLPNQVSDASGGIGGIGGIAETVPGMVPVSTDSDKDSDHGPPVSLDDVCNALLTSAQSNNLPVTFFANLIWQESRLRDDAVSPVGAMGIAQFMPQVAVASGLDNPFDPLQAIPASARLLRELRDEFRNLGFAAAAYNAGARRVSAWLENRRKLPRETRDYVVRVTGRTAEDWRKTTPPDEATLKFSQQLPCRSLPAFASVEQQLQQTQAEKAARVEKAKLEQAKLEQAKTDAAKAEAAKAEAAKAEADAAKADAAKAEPVTADPPTKVEPPQEPRSALEPVKVADATPSGQEAAPGELKPRVNIRPRSHHHWAGTRQAHNLRRGKRKHALRTAGAT